MELSKPEMELFLPLPALWSKNFFYKMFFIWSKELKINFQNRKWKYPNRKWNYFSHFKASDQKTYFTKCFSFVPRGSNLIFKTGNRIIQTGNGIISPTSRPLIKKLLLQIATLGLHLGFSAQLRIWQVPTCKMEPRSGNISWRNHPPTHPPTHHIDFPCWIYSTGSLWYLGNVWRV